MQEIPFGQQVRERRRALDLTQEELARRVACAAITVRRIEAGTMRASQQIAERLAAALAVPQDQRAAFVRAARAVVADGREPVVTPRTPQLVLSEVGQVDLNGRMIRGYQLGEQLGSGGFGAVYRAMQPLVEREVAIKIILPNFADQPDFIRRFETEAQLVARLEHPHIVPLYDYWREPGVAYLVMRLMRGGSLHGLLRQGPLSLTRISTVVGQLGAALKVAHRAGVVHRDLKPANVLLDDEQNAYLADFGIAKDLHRPAEMSFAGAFVGSPAYASPEQIRAEAITPQTDIYALGVMLYELLTGQKPFVGPTPASYLEQHLNATVPALASNRADLPPDLDQIIRRATAKLPGARYNDITDLVAEVQACIGGADRDIQQADQQAVRSYRSAAPTPTLILDLEAGDNPYQGLRPFDEATAATFFGRETLVQQLLGRLGETGELARFLAVIGPSGSGKSSVVRAGLLPALRNGALPGSEQWYIVQMLPGPQPLEQLALALHRVAPAGVEADDLLALLKSDERGLLRASRLVLPNDPAVELVLLIDQFEEIFTHIQDEQLRISILDSLVTAILDSRSRLRIIITLRADFIDRLLHYVDLGELVRQRGELVLPLTSDEIERAIVGPARWAGLTLDDGLVAMLVADVSAQPGLLPLLQHTLSELFTRREGRHLKKSAYNEVGGVVGALVHSAEALYGRLNDAEQEQAHQLFLRLVTPGEGIEDTRRRARLSELSTTKSPKSTKQARAEADEVLEQFGAARLLTFDRDQVSREPTVEVTHEALLRSWPRLRSWIDDAREELRVARRLAQAAAEWSASGHDSSYLASGARLEQFAAFTTITLTAQERAFLDASLDDRDRQIAAEKERQERELAQALALAEEQRQRAEAAGAAADASQQATKAQRRVAQSLRVLASALTIFLLVVGGLALFAIGQQREAERQALQANVRAWSAASLNNLAVDPERSLLLSLQAANATFERDRTLLPEAEDALRRSIQAAKVKYRLQLPEGTVYAIGIWSPDGQQIAIQSHNREGAKLLNVWNSTLTTKVLTTTAETEGAWASFSPNGKLLAASSDLFASDGTPKELTTHIYDLASGALRYELPLLVPQFSADGSEITGLSSAALAGANDRILTFEVASGKLLRDTEIPIPLSETISAWLSPDGERFVELLLTNDLVVFDTRTGSEMYRITDEFDTAIGAVKFSPDRRFLAVGQNSGRVEIFAIDDETAVRQVQTLLVGEADIYALEFSADSKRLAAASDRSIMVWETSNWRTQLELAGHTARIMYLAFSPDGRELLSTSEVGELRIWDALPRREGSVYFSATSNFTLSPLRTHILATGVDQQALLWDMSNQNAPLKLVGHTARINIGGWSVDQQVVATGDEAGSVRLWDATTGRQLVETSGHTAEIYGFAFSPTGDWVASGSADKTARIWDVRTGKELRRFEHAQNVNVVLFNRDGTRLYTGLSQTGEILVWDTASGELLSTWAEHRSSIFDMVLSPDGNRIATASRDGEARIWDIASGKTLLVLSGHSGDVRSIDYSPDGTLLATASFDATVRVWDAENGALLKIIPTGESAYSVAFTADGRDLIVSTENANATLFTLDNDELLRLGQERLTRDWTEAECRQYLQQETCS